MLIFYAPHGAHLVEDDGGLDGGLVADALEGLAPLLELEGLVDDALGLDLAAVEVVDGGGEHEGLGEGADDGDLVAEDLGGRPRDARRAGVDAVAHELAAAAHVVDGVLEHLGAARRLHHDVEAVRVVLLDLLPLRRGVLARQGDVRVGGVEALGELDLGALGGGNGQLGDTRVLPVSGYQQIDSPLLLGSYHGHLQELSHHETSGTSSDQQGVGAGLGGDLLETVHGARSGLDQGGVDVADVVDLEELALGVVAL